MNKKLYYLALGCLFVVGQATVSFADGKVSYKPRIINTTDLGADPDDEQSMVRFLVCSNEFDTEGLIVATGCWKKNQISTTMLDKIVNAYEQVYDNLKVHADGYPTPEYLKSISVVGQRGYGMGDVGTGKTVVALFAMLLALENRFQAVFMAPTELLAEQHHATIRELLEPLGIIPELLLGRLSAGEKQAVRDRVSSGEAGIVVGTHALIQEQTGFSNLGLVVIDEQHRFGVEQRAALIEKGEAPDVLLLSATPIPRTLALTLYGDLDMSVLKEKPVSRTPVGTAVRSSKDRSAISAFLTEQCNAGRQAYVVYPVIDESERVDLKAATTMAAELESQLAPLRVGLVHGKLKSEERNEIMRRFRDGDLDVLVATTVIEVGIDVPNATIMVIEHPERFGLAQLHQLRGRVGRGSEESHCILICDEYHAANRLKRFAKTSDGFRISEMDLKERGLGDLAGVRQSGGFSLRFADLSVDGDLVTAARSAAMKIIDSDPALRNKKHEALRARIERRYERGMELFRVG